MKLPVHYWPVKVSRHSLALLLALVLLSASAQPSAYNAHPKLVVVIVIDQFRGDYLERYRDHFGAGGFRLLLDRGANFAECYFDYAATFTSPGHATLFAGAYPRQHGIFTNEWWDPQRKKMVTAVEDASVSPIGIAGAAATPGMTGISSESARPAAAEAGASPHNLLATTLGDELKLATGGQSRVFTVALKDRAAILPGGYSADAAYWIEPQSGAFITSSYYLRALPAWATEFNRGNAGKYWEQDWKDATGKVLRHMARTTAEGKPASFYSAMGPTPFGSQYEFDFARELMRNEKLGTGPATDLLVVSISGYDILGHQVGPDAAEMRAYTLALDAQLASFLSYLGEQVGLANVWVALAADHGVAPLTEEAQRFRIPAPILAPAEIKAKLNAALGAKLGGRGEFVRFIEWPTVMLDNDAFAASKLNETDAERAVGEALRELGVRQYYTKSQLAAGVPNDAMARRFANSYSPHGGWWVLAEIPPYALPSRSGTTHGSPYSYDQHFALVLYGLPFRAGTYRTACEARDLAPTLASLLGINRPSSATGRVLTEALAGSRSGE